MIRKKLLFIGIFFVRIVMEKSNLSAAYCGQSRTLSRRSLARRRIHPPDANMRFAYLTKRLFCSIFGKLLQILQQCSVWSVSQKS